jgi:spoIIIJ-associated protein
MADAVETLTELKERVTGWAQGLAAATGLDLTVQVTRDEGQALTIAFDGPDSKLLSGRRGEVLEALQVLAASSCIGRGAPRLHLLFDAGGYRQRREEILTQMARELADEVISTGQEAELEPLPALERRIIHQVLVEIPGIRTYSEGEDPNRYIVIAPAQ